MGHEKVHHEMLLRKPKLSSRSVSLDSNTKKHGGSTQVLYGEAAIKGIYQPGVKIFRVGHGEAVIDMNQNDDLKV